MGDNLPLLENNDEAQINVLLNGTLGTGERGVWQCRPLPETNVQETGSGNQSTKERDGS